LALDALVLTIEYLKAIQTSHYRILITSIPPKPSKVGEEVKELLQNANLPVFDRGIRRFAAFQKSALQGIPVYAVKDPRAEAGWQDYENVGQEILAVMEARALTIKAQEVQEKDFF
jgi:chromosome partitioning protein